MYNVFSGPLFLDLDRKRHEVKDVNLRCFARCVPVVLFHAGDGNVDNPLKNMTSHYQGWNLNEEKDYTTKT